MHGIFFFGSANLMGFQVQKALKAGKVEQKDEIVLQVIKKNTNNMVADGLFAIFKITLKPKTRMFLLEQCSTISETFIILCAQFFFF